MKVRITVKEGKCSGGFHQVGQDFTVEHTTPEGIGIAAEKTKIKKVVLTHLTGPGTRWPPLDPKIMVEKIKKVFNGEVLIGKDLLKIEI